eukprot:6157681-Pleurochrysis_carterae.AAC.3
MSCAWIQTEPNRWPQRSSEIWRRSVLIPLSRVGGNSFTLPLVENVEYAADRSSHRLARQHKPLRSAAWRPLLVRTTAWPCWSFACSGRAAGVCARRRRAASRRARAYAGARAAAAEGRRPAHGARTADFARNGARAFHASTRAFCRACVALCEHLCARAVQILTT